MGEAAHFSVKNHETSSICSKHTMASSSVLPSHILHPVQLVFRESFSGDAKCQANGFSFETVFIFLKKHEISNSFVTVAYLIHFHVFNEKSEK